MDEVQGIDRAAVEGWYLEHVPGTVTPLQFELITGGHSNLTFRVEDAVGRSTVLRRPPLGQVLASAHDMGREHTIMRALAPTEVPVPTTLGYEPDDDVNGAPFYVTDFVEGQVLRSKEEVEAVSSAARLHAGDALVDVLASIHAVDPDEVGLGELGRKDSYVERQLRRWSGQWEKTKTRELADVDEVHRLLSTRIPDQGPATIVHGDYRLDNCMLDASGDVVAVLDWELCTLGDPLADVGLLLVYWSEPDDAPETVLTPATQADGMRRRVELVERYGEISGRDLSQIDFYVAFGSWKLACILEGVLARYVGGSMGRRTPEEFSHFGRMVEALAARARRTLEEMG